MLFEEQLFQVLGLRSFCSVLPRLQQAGQFWGVAKSGWETDPRGPILPKLLSSLDVRRLGLDWLMVIPHWPNPKGYWSYFNIFSGVDG